MIRNTSREAYKSIVNLGAKQNLVLTAIKEHKAICNYDIAEYLKVPINQVTGRTRELFQLGLVREEYIERHLKTGRQCIYWGLTPQGEKYFV